MKFHKLAANNSGKLPRPSRAERSCHILLAVCVLWISVGCSAASNDSMPVSLPVPFSGALTADANVSIAEGTPVGGSLANLKTAQKFQGTEGNPAEISWNLFGSEGLLTGTLSFFPATLSNLQLSPFPFQASPGVVREGIRRVYTFKACATLDGELSCSSNFKCFEFPTGHPPPFTAEQVVPDDPGAKAVIRKALCSGNNDATGELIDGKFLMGMVELSSGELLYHSQEISSLVIHGRNLSGGSKDPAGRIVFTLLTQGISSHVPGQPDQLSFPILFPGDMDPVGIDIHTFKQTVPLSPQLLHILADVQMFVASSAVFIHDADIVLHMVPELRDIMASMIQSKFSKDPGFDPSILDGDFFFPTVDGMAQVNCDPTAAEATGLFRELCDDFGTPNLDVRFRTSILFNAETQVIFPVEGVWVFLIPQP